jgi:hypothetical protein
LTLTPHSKFQTQNCTKFPLAISSKTGSIR